MPDPIRVLIVDDEPLAAERLAILCAEIGGVSVIGHAADGDAALAILETSEPDLLLLDIAMPRMDGVSLARHLERRAIRPAVIFITAYDHYALDAFDVAAIDYLLKPVAADRLARAIARLRDRPRDIIRPKDEIDQLWVPYRSEMVRISANSIEWIEAERDYMRLHVGPRSYLIHMTIAELEQRLDAAAFLRIHRSTIIRIDQIVRVGKSEAGAPFVELHNGVRLRIGRTYKAQLRTWLDGSKRVKLTTSEVS